MARERKLHSFTYNRKNHGTFIDYIRGFAFVGATILCMVWWAHVALENWGEIVNYWLS